MQAPLCKFRGFLKQVDRQGVGHAASIILDTAFPGFWPGDPTSPESQARTRALKQQGVDHIFHDVNPPRRLSGCWSLPRGRYFSLCNDESGDDSHTLVNELNSYLDPSRAGLLMFGDMAVPAIAQEFTKRFGIQALSGKYLLVVAIGRPGAISPVVDALGHAGLLENAIEQQRKDYCIAAVELPYSVTLCEINGAVDLRTLDAQEFLVEEFFKKDSSKLTKADRHGIDRFVETLPLLMYPEPGGGPPGDDVGAVLQAAAAFLRSQGAQALIYPSARCDVLAESKRRQLTRWRGWCLVDYRGASEPLVTGYYDLSSGWPTSFPSGAAVRVATEGDYAGSFEVTGIVHWNRQRVGEAEAKFLRGQSGKA